MLAAIVAWMFRSVLMLKPWGRLAWKERSGPQCAGATPRGRASPLRRSAPVPRDGRVALEGDGPGGEREGLAQVMRNHHHGQLGLVPKPARQGVDVGPDAGIERAERFVEEEEAAQPQGIQPT